MSDETKKVIVLALLGLAACALLAGSVFSEPGGYVEKRYLVGAGFTLGVAAMVALDIWRGRRS